MKKNKIRAHCPRCQHQQIFVRAQINHSLHFILTLLTAGLWGISWLALCIGKYVRPWRCEHCNWHSPEFGINAQLTSASRKIPRARPVLRPPPIIGTHSTPLQP